MNTKTILDISMDLNEKTVVWINDPQPELRPICRQPAAPCNFTWLNFSSHAGTHVDAPFYLFRSKWTADKIPFERLIGKCQVLDLTDVSDTITAADLKKRRITRRMVLLKTRNSFDPMKAYNPRHVAMSVDAADYLIAKGVTTIGYDYQSFEREGKNVLHTILLAKSVTVIDNLRLGHVPPGNYTLICLPLKVTGIDAAPARAILVRP